MAPNIPTLEVYADYQNAYGKVWCNGLVVKLFRMGITLLIPFMDRVIDYSSILLVGLSKDQLLLDISVFLNIPL